MKIAFIYDALYPEVKGGVERRLYEIGRRLAKKHEVRWYTFNWWGPKDSMERDGIIIHGVGSPLGLYRGGKRDPIEALAFSLRLLMKKVDTSDVIDCQQFPYLPCFSAKVHSIMRNIPLVITWHEVWGGYWEGYLGKLGIAGIKIERMTSALTRNNVSVSRLTQKRLHSLGVKSELVPNGVDFKGIQEIPRKNEEYDVIFVGRLIKEKNVDLLLRAVKMVKNSVPDLRVLIIGEGPEKDRLVSLASSLELSKNIKFLGFLRDHEEVISYLKSSKVFVLPSKREGFGIVVLEANASGLPVITLDYPMNASKDLIIHGYNGFISQPAPDSLAEYIENLLFSGKKFKRNCMKVAKRYDWENIAELTERFYERVLNER